MFVAFVEIDTFWNVKQTAAYCRSCSQLVEIDTFWNVKALNLQYFLKFLS